MTPLLRPEDVAGLLGTSVRNVLDLARAYVRGDPNGLPGIKVLREWRFTAQDIEAYVAANRTQPKAASPVLVPRVPAAPAGAQLTVSTRRRRR